MLATTQSQTDLSETVNSLTPHHSVDGGYINTDKDFTENTAILPLLKRYITEDRIDALPKNAIPLIEQTAHSLEQLPHDQDSVIRLGHSSIFIQISGQRWLIDPVFSDRASPFSFAGPKRFHQPPISLESLPHIDGVMISHDHYDHLDKQTIKYLANKVKHFVVPLGVDKHLVKWGVPATHIQSLDWWQSANFGKVTLTATPTQHFSGRGLFDKNETLWASYVIESETHKLFFSGDSGYFDGFKQIGERFGPFDLTMVETGAYDKDWPTIHMTPEQSLQAHIDLRGHQMMPIHNGTFDLAFHSWYEPLNRITELAKQMGVDLLTPIMGQIVSVGKTPETSAWWEHKPARISPAD